MKKEKQEKKTKATRPLKGGAEPAAPRLVVMVRDGDVEPKRALVHPAEIENYAVGGWRVEGE